MDGVFELFVQASWNLYTSVLGSSGFGKKSILKIFYMDVLIHMQNVCFSQVCMHLYLFSPRLMIL